MTSSPHSPGGRRRGVLRDLTSTTLLPAALAALLLGGLIFVAAPSRSGAAERPRATMARMKFESLDHEFAYAAGTVPGGFGGWFLDEEGRPNVYLVDLGQRDAAVEALAPFFRDRYVSVAGRSTADWERMIVLQGQYDFRFLQDWRERISEEAPHIPGMVMTDVEERTNRVEVAVEDETAARQVRAAMLRLGIPSGAVVIGFASRDSLFRVPRARAPSFEEESALQVRTLRDYAPSVAAGYRIRWLAVTRRGSYYDACTLGFNAWRPASGARRQRVFVTASHCTRERLGPDGKEFWQGTPGRTSTYIGKEVYDPEGDQGRDEIGCEYGRRVNPEAGKCCPLNKKCRWTDGIIAAWEGPVARWGYGTIARVNPPPSENIPEDDLRRLQVNSTNQVYQIRGEKAYPMEGEDLYIMGGTSGMRRGRLVESCIHAWPEPTQALRCQHQTNIPVEGGDSGGPVFSLSTDGHTSWVYLRGIIWAAESMSSMENLEKDFGDLDTFACVRGNPDYPRCWTAQTPMPMPVREPIWRTYPIPLPNPLPLPNPPATRPRSP